MENKVQIFCNADFGQLRTVEVNGEIYFVGKDVAEILGYANTRDALAKHVDDEDKGESQIATPSGVQEMVIINESGLYSLILSSKLPAAKKFKRWVTSEVLPAIRKYGGYFIQPQLLKGNEIQLIKTMADDIQTLFAGVRRGIAISQAIDLVSVNNNLKLDALKKMLPPAEHDTGYLNATQIGEKIGIPAKNVNKLLAMANLQYKDGKDWRITQTGREYGEELPYTRHGHSGYRILWNNKVMEVF